MGYAMESSDGYGAASHYNGVDWIGMMFVADESGDPWKIMMGQLVFEDGHPEDFEGWANGIIKLYANEQLNA